VGRRPARNGRGGLARGGGPKGGLKAAFAAEVVAEIDALVGADAVEAWDFEAIETAARRAALRVAARAVEQRINADTSDHVGPAAPCACGQPARYAGRRAKTVTSVLGALTLARAYFHCDPCAAGFCPRDAALGVAGASLSPGVLRMVGLVGATVSFAEGHEFLRDLAGVQVPTTHVERAAEALGREIAAEERRVVEPPPPDEPVAPTLYLGMDGTGVPMRPSELAGHAGKQPDGSSKTREVKLCTVWSAEGRDEEGTPVRDAGSVTDSAAIESAAQRDTDTAPSEFAARVEREAVRRGFARAARRVVLGDGARYDELDAGQLDAVLHALQPHAAAHDEARKCVEYVARNRERMRYPEFKAAGLCTSTGWSRPAARSRSARAASAPACTGPWRAPTRSSRCAAASSADASRTSGSAGQPPGRRPHELISQI
jgi:hypothetical protein